MTDTADISVVNNLIEVTIDSADGYRKAADDADNLAFQKLFYARADERDELIEQMQDFVRKSGGEPADEGSLTAGAHRIFIDLRDRLVGGDDDAVIAEVERGEDHIKHRFEAALREPSLAPETRALIEAGMEIIVAGHDQISDLKHGRAGVMPQ